MTIGAGVAFSIASYENSVGINDDITNFVFWALFVAGAYAALWQGTHGLSNSGRMLTAAALLLTLLPFWIGRAAFWVVWAVVRMILLVLKFTFVTVLGNLGLWAWRRVTGGQGLFSGAYAQPEKPIYLQSQALTPKVQEDTDEVDRVLAAGE